MVRNMTKGSVVLHILLFFVPLLFANILQLLYPMADAYILGYFVSTDALAVSNSCIVITSIITGVIIGFTHGFSVLISQRFGSGDIPATKKAVAMGACLSLALSMILTCLLLILIEPIVVSRWPAPMVDDILLYFRIIILGITASVFYNYCAAVLRALGDTILPFVVVLVGSILNAGLTYLFAVMLHWGVAGAAIATVATQLLSGFACLFIIKRTKLLPMDKSDWKMETRVIAKLLALGLPVGLMGLMASVGTPILQYCAASLGMDAMLPYTVGFRMFQYAVLPVQLIGFSLSSFVAQNLGAKNIARVREGVKKGLLMTLILSVAVGAITLLYGKAICLPHLPANDPAMLNSAYIFLLVTGVMLPVLGCALALCFSLISMGRTVIPMAAAGIELLLMYVIASNFSLSLGFLGICLAKALPWIALLAILAITYYVIMKKLKTPEGNMYGENGA